MYHKNIVLRCFVSDGELYFLHTFSVSQYRYAHARQGCLCGFPGDRTTSIQMRHIWDIWSQQVDFIYPTKNGFSHTFCFGLQRRPLLTKKVAGNSSRILIVWKETTSLATLRRSCSQRWLHAAHPVPRLRGGYW